LEGFFVDQAELFPDIYSKAALIDALQAMERREPTTRIRGAVDCYPVLLEWAGADKEHFIVITLNGTHEIINTHVVSVGLLNRTLVHPREVFRPALFDNAVAIVVAHNHPSGNVMPSEEDRDVTASLRDAGEILRVPVLDHIVFSNNGFYSFLEHNWGV
jgi:DNA repair protein RadC